jgi:hypothetical protein
VAAVATLTVQDESLVVTMSALEKAEAIHGEIRVPLSSVRDVRAVDDPWPELRGIRAPGTGLPHVIAVGTRRGEFGKDFAVVHGNGPAVVVDLVDAEYARLVVSSDDAASVAARLRHTVAGS